LVIRIIIIVGDHFLSSSISSTSGVQSGSFCELNHSGTCEELSQAALLEFNQAALLMSSSGSTVCGALKEYHWWSG